MTVIVQSDWTRGQFIKKGDIKKPWAGRVERTIT
jgi:hypothetical protein